MSVSVSDQLLRPSNLKIERAKHHINDLNRAIAIYMARQPFALMVDDNGQTGERVIRIEQHEPFPDDLALILGDAIHNLRSALDLTIFGMVGGKARRPQSVQFPFAQRSDTLVGTIKNREIQLAGKNVVEAIKGFKPYKGGNERLYSLYDLDICDKHKLIIPVVGTSEIPGRLVELMAPGIIIPSGGVGMGLNSVIRLEFAPAPNAPPASKEKTEIQPTFKICLDDGSIVPSQPVIERLWQFVGCTQEVVERLVEEFCSDPTAKP